MRYNAVPVLVVGLRGKNVALSLIGRLVLIDLLAYGQLTKYGGLVSQSDLHRG